MKILRHTPHLCWMLLLVPAWPVVCQPAIPPQPTDADVLRKSAALYLPMDEKQILATPKEGVKLALTGEPVFVKGKVAQALALDSTGVSASVLKLTGNDMMDPERGTIAFWFRPLTELEKGRRRYLFSLQSSTNKDQVLDGCLSEEGKFFFQGKNAGHEITPQIDPHPQWLDQPSWSPERWCHLAMTWAPDQKTVFYLDGAKVRATPDDRYPGFSAGIAPIDTILIGCDPYGKRQANALFDEFLILREPLKPEDIPNCAPGLKTTAQQLREALEKLK